MILLELILAQLSIQLLWLDFTGYLYHLPSCQVLRFMGQWTTSTMKNIHCPALGVVMIPFCYFKKNDNPSEDQEVAAFSIKPVLEQKRNCRSLEDIMNWSRLKFANIPIAQQYVALLFQPYKLIGVTLLVHQVNCTVYGYIFAIRRILIEYKTSLLLQRLIVFYFGEGNQVKTREGNQVKTLVAFTLIIPHPVTDYNTINTAMVIFQDVLSQKGLDYGPLWCENGVYRTAKGQQFQNPVQFLFQLIILR